MTEFILMGITNQPELQVPLFVLFLMIYIVTLVGNLGMIVLIKTEPRLHTPMYFFLSHLAFVDLCYSSTITPKMLVNFLAENRTISFNACAAQLGCFLTFMITECFLLAVMAYDRYVAICNPLLYKAVMSQKVCFQLVAGPYIYSFCVSLFHTIITFRLSFCDSNMINHFYCDDLPLLALSCSNIHTKQILIFAFAGFDMITSVLIVLISYLYIFSTILRINTVEQRYKAFSTCASHLIAVTLFYGTLIFMYLQPSSSHSLDTDKVASVFYTVVIPMLNPMIYTLRNREVKAALKKVISKRLEI
ncbi:olfactory receptor 8U3-like [Alligator mississippiensis]|uniref:olfactory receptor 8U3-like n=1 Tax=Alligator mississippiensis TaxID=8496 RepID=UPI002877E67C|nr:olfactory receptor 8U3-like [Alligator mississippiensis]